MYRKSASLAGGAIDMNSSPMRLDNRLDDAQTQADTRDIVGSGIGHPMETVEDLFNVTRREADACVGNHQGHPFRARLQR